MFFYRNFIGVNEGRTGEIVPHLKSVELFNLALFAAAQRVLLYATLRENGYRR